MKLLIASDIHGSLSAARKVVQLIAIEQADYLVFLGDAMYHGPRNPLPDSYDPAGVAAILNTVASQVIATRGNCDSEVDQMLLDFTITADYQVIPLRNGKLFATHGHVFEPNNLPSSLTRGDIFASGHTHVPVLTVADNGVIVINPGSVSLPKENHPPTYAMVTDTEILIKTFDQKIYRELMR